MHIAPSNGGGPPKPPLEVGRRTLEWGGPPKPPLEVGRRTPTTPKHFSRIPATPKHLARKRLFLITQSPRCGRGLDKQKMDELETFAGDWI